MGELDSQQRVLETLKVAETVQRNIRSDVNEFELLMEKLDIQREKQEDISGLIRESTKSDEEDEQLMQELDLLEKEEDGQTEEVV